LTTDTTLSIAAGTSIVLPTNTADSTKPTVIKDLANNNATLSLATALTTFTAPPSMATPLTSKSRSQMHSSKLELPPQ